MIIEVVLSQSSTRLQLDAHWLLTKSSNDVKIVILVSLSCDVSKVKILKWEFAPPPPRVTTRAMSVGLLVLTKT